MITTDETLVEVCADELWGGVYCTLPPGHAGSHESSPSRIGGCALTWTARKPPAPELSQLAPIDSFLRMVRGASAHR